MSDGKNRNLIAIAAKPMRRAAGIRSEARTGDRERPFASAGSPASNPLLMLTMSAMS
jgi:hypothetical protein